MEDLFDRYVNALGLEISQYNEPPMEKLSTLFFGGGTPTVVGAKRLVEIMELCKKTFGVADDAEVSTEANPETVTASDLRQLRDAGFNRISFGVQSFHDSDLRQLGRPHTVARAMQAIEDARGAGFENLNLDLMSGLAGQSSTDWEKVLSTALTLHPEHLSVYQLTPEEGTPLYDDIATGRVILPDDDVSLEMDRVTRLLCNEAGLAQYEISNYATLDKECRHNINYWRNNSYRAFGAGAVSYIDGVREKRTGSPIEYCEKIESVVSPIDESEKLGGEASCRETVVIGLRLNAGVDLTRIKERYNIDLVSYYGGTLRKLQASGLVEIADGSLRLTEKGRPIANLVMVDLV